MHHCSQNSVVKLHYQRWLLCIFFNGWDFWRMWLIWFDIVNGNDVIQFANSSMSCLRILWYWGAVISTASHFVIKCSCILMIWCFVATLVAVMRTCTMSPAIFGNVFALIAVSWLSIIRFINVILLLINFVH